MLESWGRYPLARHLAEVPLAWRDERLPDARPLLAVGAARSYGDCCLNDGGTLVRTTGLDRFISFDAQTGVLRCEAGATLGDILEVVVPRGWFVPVLPGTKHVTVGGAIANDIHGKNHHRAGTFGRHVRKLELLRSSGERIECSPGEPLFAATIAGLGLTGLITWAELQLAPAPGPAMRVETATFGALDEFFALSEESDARFPYTVAWIDTLSGAGRGVFFRGEHAEGQVRRPASGIRLPVDLPAWTLNAATVRAFNAVYRARHRLSRGPRIVHYESFFFPLDAMAGWNRAYGRRGFLQFQCVVPDAADIHALLAVCAVSGQASFLGVLKKFGDLPSPGLISFPRRGYTLALDFPNRGVQTFALFARLEAIVKEARGALYPAKDALMSRETFAASYPAAEELRTHVDPGFSSSFWRRVS